MQMSTDNTLQRKTLIVGLGKTGVSCARYLSAQGVDLAVTDSRMEPPGMSYLKEHLPNVAVYLGGFNNDAFAAAEQLVVSPGVSLREPMIAAAMRRGVPVLGDIEIFARQVRAPVIAITGSNGKSTVTTLVAEMARHAGRNVRVGGNLGMPALDLLAEASGGNDNGDDTGLFVLELSSFQLETTESLNAVAAVVLNISADHMDRYDSLQSYAATKQRIYHGDGVLVINDDDDMVTDMLSSVGKDRRVLHFSLCEPAGDNFGLRDVHGKAWLCRGNQALLAESDLKLPGRHNTANALAALALGQVAGLDDDAMTRTLKTFTGLPHRSQWLGEANGVSWYNDSKATNVGATLALINGMPATPQPHLILIAGGEGKGADFSALKTAMNGKLKRLILIGRDAPLIELAIDGVVSVEHASDLQQAVELASRCATGGDSVVLSPACASFDMFDNFEHRGEVFMTAVREVLE